MCFLSTVKVIERCRSLEDAELIAERKKQRELEGGEKGERMDKNEKELIKQERKAANAIKKQERLAKKAARIDKQDSKGLELTTVKNHLSFKIHGFVAAN